MKEKQQRYINLFYFFFDLVWGQGLGLGHSWYIHENAFALDSQR